MTEDRTSLASIYKGWDIYQQHLVKAIAPLCLNSSPCVPRQIFAQNVGIKNSGYHGDQGHIRYSESDVRKGESRGLLT